MNFNLPGWVSEAGELVYAYLLKKARDGQAQVSIRELADKLTMARNTARKYLHVLEEAGVLRWVRPIKTDGSFGASIFELKALVHPKQAQLPFSTDLDPQGALAGGSSPSCYTGSLKHTRNNKQLPRRQKANEQTSDRVKTGWKTQFPKWVLDYASKARRECGAFGDAIRAFAWPLWDVFRSLGGGEWMARMMTLAMMNNALMAFKKMAAREKIKQPVQLFRKILKNMLNGYLQEAAAG